ncbi:MAG TPA: hypothetical protein VJR06_00945, partial [Nitrososphaerales archaeon]|nr:hypothetical protein [Nitrososphaerales archaeon]
MRTPGFRRRSRAAVSTVIGTIIFIIAALSIFTALAATNVAGMNYQNAAQQASNRNGVKSQELIQAAPVYDTSAYAEFSATESTNPVNFGMSYTSPVDWTEAALAVNNTAGVTLMQHYANACPGSQACSLTLTYPPAVNNTLVVGVSISNVGSSLSGSVSVTDNRGLTMTLRNASSLQSGNSYFASQIWTSGYVVSGSETHRITVTVSGSKAPSDTFSVFVYDIAAGKSPVYTSRHTSALAPTPIGVTKVPGHNHFFLAVVTAPSSWQALPAPGFTLESSPPRPSELTLTNGWSSTTSFTTVIYVYHMWSGSYNATLGQYVEAFNPNSGTCISPTGTAALSTGLTCTYAVPRGTVGQGLAKPFNLTDSGQKLSVGFTTALGNTFWYNYTGYVAMNLGPSSNAGYPYVPDISDLINTVVARGLGPAKLTFPAFTYYWNGGGAGGIGSGFNVDGYFGFAVPTGVSVVWEV